MCEPGSATHSAPGRATEIVRGPHSPVGKADVAVALPPKTPGVWWGRQESERQGSRQRAQSQSWSWGDGRVLTEGVACAKPGSVSRQGAREGCAALWPVARVLEAGRWSSGAGASVPHASSFRWVRPTGRAGPQVQILGCPLGSKGSSPEAPPSLLRCHTDTSPSLSLVRALVAGCRPTSGVSSFSDHCKDQVGAPPVGATSRPATAASTLTQGDICPFTGTIDARQQRGPEVHKDLQ